MSMDVQRISAETAAGEKRNPGISAACRFVIDKIYEGIGLLHGQQLTQAQELAARKDWMRRVLMDEKASLYVSGRDASSFEQCLNNLSGVVWDRLSMG